MANHEAFEAEGIRNFHIGDIISVTTDVLVSPRGIRGFSDILSYMVGEDLFTHALIRASKECAPDLVRQHPDLADIEVPEFRDEDHFATWIGEMVVKHGELRPVIPLHPDDHTVIDPIQELHLMGYGDKIIALEVPDDREY